MNINLNITTTPLALPTGVTAGQLKLWISTLDGQSVADTSGNGVLRWRVYRTRQICLSIPYVSSNLESRCKISDCAK